MTRPAARPASRPARIDQWALHKALCTKIQGLKPEDVGKMTLAEIAVVLDDENRGPLGAAALTDEQVLAEAEKWNKFRPLDWLRNFQR